MRYTAVCTLCLLVSKQKTLPEIFPFLTNNCRKTTGSEFVNPCIVSLTKWL